MLLCRLRCAADAPVLFVMAIKDDAHGNAGCKEDHVSRYFAGIEGYRSNDGVRTFSKPGLEKIFKKLGIEEYRFFYPYPDYKFMHTLFSDERLPFKGELSDNKRNFDQDRMELFSEKEAFDSLIADGRFDEFSNSFLVVPKVLVACQSAVPEELL